ncbi:MAG: uracil-DNA glycosylase, partial [Romboutsia sp.]|nr:uracil-DNA glycosylase [Romboutsia sp.]
MIGNNWDNVLNEELKKEYFQELMSFIKNEYKTKTIYPKQSEVFNAFRYTDFDDVKVVILGQDPYHGPKQAEGLSFSVSNEVLKPPSLKNIFKELENDLGIKYPESNSLKPWAKEGVLLLNAVLTVEEHKPTSHKDKGWETFTDEIIRTINTKETPVVFILWGAYARKKKE